MVNHEYSRTNEFQTKRVYSTFLTIEHFDEILSRTFQEFFGTWFALGMGGRPRSPGIFT